MHLASLTARCDTCCCLQTNVNEIVAASVVHLAAARVDRSMGQAEWNSAAMLRHFSVLRKLEGRPYPPGKNPMAVRQ